MKLIEQSPPGIRIYLKYQWNLMQTGFLLLTWIIMGLHLELINATSPRLAEHTKIGYGDIVSALALRNFGYLIANMLGLIIPNTVDKYPEGLLILSFIISAIMVCATPFIGRLIVAIVSLMFSVYNCMNIIWFGGLCSALGWLLLIWTTDLTLTTLNLLSAITGLIFAPLFPLSLGLINQRLNITPVFLALLLCASSLGSIIFENLAGK
ncbi:hypothetical protein I4U23_023325 [Adineta vaga]|nr:hypothetical protein I4U23_023325 [Adineta vaga]